MSSAAAPAPAPASAPKRKADEAPDVPEPADKKLREADAKTQEALWNILESPFDHLEIKERRKAALNDVLNTIKPKILGGGATDHVQILMKREEGDLLVFFIPAPEFRRLFSPYLAAGLTDQSLVQWPAGSFESLDELVDWLSNAEREFCVDNEACSDKHVVAMLKWWGWE